MTDPQTLEPARGAVMLPASPHRFFLNRDLDGTFQEVTDCLAKGKKAKESV